MAKHKYFELHEFIESQSAKNMKISNIPTFAEVEHLNELVGKFLDPLREAYGAAICVSSGYRCEELNRAVGGVATSAHKSGYAADLTVAGDFDKFCNFVVEWTKKAGTRFDQIIIEQNKKTGERWLHVGLKNQLGQQRGQVLKIEK